MPERAGVSGHAVYTSAYVGQSKEQVYLLRRRKGRREKGRNGAKC